MEQLYHKKKGILTKKGKKYNALSNKTEDIYIDSKGKQQRLDGTEIPYENKVAMDNQENAKSAEERQAEVEQADQEELDKEQKLRHEAKKEQKHKELLDAIKTAPEAIVEAIKAIPEQEVVEEVTIKNTKDFSSEINKQLKDSTLKIISAIEKTEPDNQDVIDAISKIKLEIPKAEKQQFIDYTRILTEISGKIGGEIDLSPLIIAIANIPQFEIPSSMISSSGRLKVEVDQVAVGGSGGGGGSIDISTLATEETLSALNSTLTSRLSDLNSTTTPLTAGATYTGAWEESVTYSSASVNIKTDQLGTAYFENSADGVTTDRSFAHALTDTVNYNLYFSVAPKSKYFRIRYVNTGGNQSIFRIQTILAIPERGAVYLPINESLTDNSTAKLVRSVLTGRTTAGGSGYVNVKVNPSGALTTSVGDSVLPTGAATETTLAAAKVDLDTLAGTVTTGKVQVNVTNTSVPVTGTFWQATQPVSLASVPSHNVTNAGTFAVQATLGAETTKVIGTVRNADGAGNLLTSTTNALDVNIKSGTVTTHPVTIIDGGSATLGAKTDAKSTATDATSVSAMSVLKQISASVQAPPSQAVTNAGVFAVQATNQANSGIDIGDVTINNAAGAAAVNIQDGGNSITIDGSVSVSSSALPTGAATETTLAAIKAKTDNIPALGQALAAGSVPVVLTAAQLTTLTPVAGLTDAQLRATAVPVSLASVPSHNVTNAGTFAVQATNQANSGVDIGDVTINNASGAAAVNIQDGGNSITVDGAVTATLNAETTKVIGVTRTADGAGNLLTSTTNALDINIKSGNPTSITANAGTNLNTSALALEAGNLAIIAGAVSTAKMQVNVTNASIPVTGSFYQATQPVSASALPLPTGAATETTLQSILTANSPKLVKYDYDVSQNLIYKGTNASATAADSDATWNITKNTYDVNGNITIKKTLTGAWSSRTSLSW